MSPNDTTFGIQIEQRSGTGGCPVCQGFTFRVIDNGNPGKQDMPDLIGTGFQIAPPIGNCPIQGTQWDVTSGNITVKNLTP